MNILIYIWYIIDINGNNNNIKWNKYIKNKCDENQGCSWNEVKL